MALLMIDKLMMMGQGRVFLLKVTWGLKKSPEYVFWLKKLKSDHKLALKSTGITLLANPTKMYHAVYVSEEKDVALCLSKPFLIAVF